MSLIMASPCFQWHNDISKSISYLLFCLPWLDEPAFYNAKFSIQWYMILPFLPAYYRAASHYKLPFPDLSTASYRTNKRCSGYYLSKSWVVLFSHFFNFQKHQHYFAIKTVFINDRFIVVSVNMNVIQRWIYVLGKWTNEVLIITPW